jgi:hypothetical protein
MKKSDLMSATLFHVDILLSTSGENLHNLIHTCFGVCYLHPVKKFQHTLNASDM